MEAATGIAVGLALFVFGLGYNAFAAWMERQDDDRAYVSLLVAFGTLVTVGASGLLIGWLDALIVLGCFIASGLPMIAGSVYRYIQRRSADRAAAIEVARRVLDGR